MALIIFIYFFVFNGIYYKCKKSKLKPNIEEIRQRTKLINLKGIQYGGKQNLIYPLKRLIKLTQTEKTR